MHTRMGTFEVQRANLDEVLATLQDQVVPAFSKHTGFLGYQAHVDRERSLIVGISVWATHRDLEASAETGRYAVGLVARLGAAVVGDMQILELAFDARP